MKSIRPSFKAKSQVGKTLVTRVGRAVFGDDVRHPDHELLRLSDSEFTSPAVYIQDESGNHRLTFLTGDYFHKDYLTGKKQLVKGDKVAASYPVYDSGPSRENVFGAVSNIQPSLCDTWLESLIRAGAAPQILDNISLTFDFVVSLRTASEIGASVWNYSSIQDYVYVWMSKNSVEDEVNKILETISEKSAEEVRSLLPLCTKVNATASKTIAGWRNWLLSIGGSPESVWLKVQFFKYLDDAVHSLFVGCERVLETAQSMEELFRS